MSDGGHVCLDWYNEYNPTQPIVIILPGLAGNVVSRAPDSFEKESGNCSRVSVCWCRNVDTTI